MKKRILSLLLVLVMAFGLVACTNEPDGPTGTYDPGLQEDDPKTWLSHDKVTLTVLTNEGSSTENPPASNDLPFWAWLEEYTNVHIEWEIASAVGYPEVVTTRLSAGEDLPDIIMVNTLGNAEKAGNNGVLVDLAPYWDTHFINTNAYWDAQGLDFESHITTADGSIYALTGMAEPVEGHITLMYNTDWLKKLNTEVPTTLDEFTDLLRKMKAAGDLNGNGQSDEIPFTADSINGLMSGFGTTFGIEQYEAWDAFVADENGVVSSEYNSDNQKAYLKYLSELFKEGLLDKEIANMNVATLTEKIASDRIGVFCYYSSFAISYGQLTPRAQAEKNPYGEYYTLGVALDSEYNGNDGFFMRRERALGAPTSITSECDNVELACRWLDTLYADPMVLNVRQYGMPGEDWEFDENGEVKLLYPEDGSPRDISAKGCGQIPLCHFQTVEQLTAGMEQYAWYTEQYQKMRECTWKSPTVKHIALFTDEEQELMAYYNVDVKGVYGEYRAKFITGQLSVDADWDTYLNEIKKMGIDELTRAWQMIHDRTK